MRPPDTIRVPCPGCGATVAVPVTLVTYTGTRGRLLRLRAHSRPFEHTCATPKSRPTRG